jgi:branched-chain amino acid transport system substrate-binding protein
VVTLQLSAEQKPILVGEISSYSTVPAFTRRYRNGWQLAVEEITRRSRRKKIEVISRDDAGSRTMRPEAPTAERQKVSLAGTFLPMWVSQ